VRTGRVCRPVCAINDRMSNRPYRFARYPRSRMADLKNKTIASSRTSKLLLDRTGQLEINSILFYERSHACVRYCGFETVFDVGGRKGPGSLLCSCRPALGTAHHKQQNTGD
jgi:hypothetical protein